MKVKFFKGFTLVELMVVISIIAILSVIGFTVFTRVQISARDAKRLADIKALQQALEEYYHVNGFYPHPNPLADVRPSSMNELKPYFSAGQIPDDPNPKEGGPTVGRPLIGFDYGYLACLDSTGVARQYFLCTYISDCRGKCNADVEPGIAVPSPVPGVGYVTQTYPYPCDSYFLLKPDGQGTHFYCQKSQSE